MIKIYIILGVFSALSILFGIIVAYSNPEKAIFEERDSLSASFTRSCAIFESIFATVFITIAIISVVFYSFYPFGDMALYVQIVSLTLAVWFPRHRVIRMLMHKKFKVSRWFIWESFSAWRNMYVGGNTGYENKYIHTVYIGNWRVVEWALILVIILCGTGPIIKTYRFNEANTLLNKYYTQEELSTYSNEEKFKIVCKINERLKSIEMFEQEARERTFKSEVLDRVDSRITGTPE